MARSLCDRGAVPEAAFREDDAKCLDIALVNNMPGPALENTERQFRTLLQAAAGEFTVRLLYYAFPETPRSGAAREWINQYYRGTNDLLNGRIDGLIVTGAEPHAPKLQHEPYYGSLAILIDWARQNTHSAIWSCLAAHAAVFHLDGIERRALEQKRFGVFACMNRSVHPLTSSVSQRFCMPHSRWNEIPEPELANSGYSVLSSSEDAGTDAFVKEGHSLFVFFQGHPEYEPDTLMLEYCRDIRRFLKSELARYPSMPRDYFDQRTADQMIEFRRRVFSESVEIGDLPATVAASRPRSTWSPAADRIYRNWLQYLNTQKERRLRTKQRRRTAQQAA